MGNWIVLKRLWSNTNFRYHEIGDEIELSDSAAAELVRRNLIKPAEHKPATKTKSEVDNGTDN